MYKTWYDVFPEIATIKDKKLQEQVVATCQEALQTGGWVLDDLDRIPYTLNHGETKISYHTHVEAVTRMAIKIFEAWDIYKPFDKGLRLNYDHIVAGAVLHDVGKLIEDEETPDKKIVKSKLGKNLRHPFSGAALAIKNGVPYEVAHIIANHAKEGDGTLRSPEAVIINKCDTLNLQALLSFAGKIS